ncbi:peptidyl-prolyl cis-trans isomerase H [Pelomyxa schiedti]|nr:peptidyl-prolyl cis-trans isomerase H [Pelomyxa schiedti]
MRGRRKNRGGHKGGNKGGEAPVDTKVDVPEADGDDETPKETHAMPAEGEVVLGSSVSVEAHHDDKEHHDKEEHHVIVGGDVHAEIHVEKEKHDEAHADQHHEEEHKVGLAVGPAGAVSIEAHGDAHAEHHEEDHKVEIKADIHVGGGEHDHDHDHKIEVASAHEEHHEEHHEESHNVEVKAEVHIGGGAESEAAATHKLEPSAEPEHKAPEESAGLDLGLDHKVAVKVQVVLEDKQHEAEAHAEVEAHVELEHHAASKPDSHVEDEKERAHASFQLSKTVELKDEGISANKDHYGHLIAHKIHIGEDPFKHSDYPHVFFDIGIGEKAAGRIVMELLVDVAPKTCAAFQALCSGKHNDGNGHDVSFKGTHFHRVSPGIAIYGGLIPEHTGLEVAHEPSHVRHTCQGLVSVDHSRPGTKEHQFMITTTPAPWLDNVCPVFARVIDGIEVCHEIARQRHSFPNYRPHKEVVIQDCGCL